MMKKSLAAVLHALILSNAVESTALPERDPSTEDKSDNTHSCKGLGFGPSLVCSTCGSIKDIVADEDLTKECSACCRDTKRSVRKYASAKLVYDPRLLRADAELRGFVEDRAADHPALTLQPTLFAKTSLVMSVEGAKDGEADTVSIRRWKVDSIADYLKEHL